MTARLTYLYVRLRCQDAGGVGAEDDDIFNCTERVRISHILELKPGDAIGFRRPGYKHHAIVSGIFDENRFTVIHLTGASDICLSSGSKKADLAENSYDFCKIQHLYKYIYNNQNKIDGTENKLKCLFRARTLFRYGLPVEYNVLTFNCHHFVSYCATGIPYSSKTHYVNYDAKKVLDSEIQRRKETTNINREPSCGTCMPVNEIQDKSDRKNDHLMNRSEEERLNERLDQDTSPGSQEKTLKKASLDKVFPTKGILPRKDNQCEIKHGIVGGLTSDVFNIKEGTKLNMSFNDSKLEKSNVDELIGQPGIQFENSKLMKQKLEVLPYANTDKTSHQSFSKIPNRNNLMGNDLTPISAIAHDEISEQVVCLGETITERDELDTIRKHNHNQSENLELTKKNQKILSQAHTVQTSNICQSIKSTTFESYDLTSNSAIAFRENLKQEVSSNDTKTESDSLDALSRQRHKRPESLELQNKESDIWSKTINIQKNNRLLSKTRYYGNRKKRQLSFESTVSSEKKDKLAPYLLSKNFHRSINALLKKNESEKVSQSSNAATSIRGPSKQLFSSNDTKKYSVALDESLNEILSIKDTKPKTDSMDALNRQRDDQSENQKLTKRKPEEIPQANIVEKDYSVPSKILSSECCTSQNIKLKYTTRSQEHITQEVSSNETRHENYKVDTLSRQSEYKNENSKLKKMTSTNLSETPYNTNLMSRHSTSYSAFAPEENLEVLTSTETNSDSNNVDLQGRQPYNQHETFQCNENSTQNKPAILSQTSNVKKSLSDLSNTLCSTDLVSRHSTSNSPDEIKELPMSLNETNTTLYDVDALSTPPNQSEHLEHNERKTQCGFQHNIVMERKRLRMYSFKQKEPGIVSHTKNVQKSKSDGKMNESLNDTQPSRKRDDQPGILKLINRKPDIFSPATIVEEHYSGPSKNPNSTIASKEHIKQVVSANHTNRENDHVEALSIKPDDQSKDFELIKKTPEIMPQTQNFLKSTNSPKKTFLMGELWMSRNSTPKSATSSTEHMRQAVSLNDTEHEKYVDFLSRSHYTHSVNSKHNNKVKEILPQADNVPKNHISTSKTPHSENYMCLDSTSKYTSTSKENLIQAVSQNWTNSQNVNIDILGKQTNNQSKCTRVKKRMPKISSQRKFAPTHSHSHVETLNSRYSTTRKRVATGKDLIQAFSEPNQKTSGNLSQTNTNQQSLSSPPCTEPLTLGTGWTNCDSKANFATSSTENMTQTVSLNDTKFQSNNIVALSRQPHNLSDNFELYEKELDIALQIRNVQYSNILSETQDRSNYDTSQVDSLNDIIPKNYNLGERWKKYFYPPDSECGNFILCKHSSDNPKSESFFNTANGLTEITNQETWLQKSAENGIVFNVDDDIVESWLRKTSQRFNFSCRWYPSYRCAWWL